MKPYWKESYKSGDVIEYQLICGQFILMAISTKNGVVRNMYKYLEPVNRIELDNTNYSIAITGKSVEFVQNYLISLLNE